MPPIKEKKSPLLAAFCNSMPVSELPKRIQTICQALDVRIILRTVGLQRNQESQAGERFNDLKKSPTPVRLQGLVCALGLV